MADADLEKRRRINREAAAKARRKQREAVESLRKNVLTLEAEKTKLQYDNGQLQKKTARFMTLCKTHAHQCPLFRAVLLEMHDSFGPKKKEEEQTYYRADVEREVEVETDEEVVRAAEEAEAYAEEQSAGGDMGNDVKSEESAVEVKEEDAFAEEKSYVSRPSEMIPVPSVPVVMCMPGKRAPKRVAKAQEHAIRCNSNVRSSPTLQPTENVPQIRHFAKARKSAAISPLVQDATATTHVVTSHGAIQTTTMPNVSTAGSDYGYQQQNQQDSQQQQQQHLDQTVVAIHGENGENIQYVIVEHGEPEEGLPSVLMDFPSEQSNVKTDVITEDNQSYQAL